MEHFKETTFRRLFSPSLLMIKRSRLRKSLNNTVILVSSWKKNWNSIKLQNTTGELEHDAHPSRKYSVHNSYIRFKKNRCYYIVVYFLCSIYVQGYGFFDDFPCENNVQNCALDRYFLGFQRLTSPFLL